MLGRTLLTLSALSLSFGAYLADFNETHVLNPNWPPHARFHNGQTMSLGLLLGLSAVYYAWRPLPSKRTAADSLFTAALLGSFYWVAGLSAILYPGSKGMDPEFGEGFPQAWLFVGELAVVWFGWWLEGEGKEKGMKVA